MRMAEGPRAAVIGSGFGGLATAIRLQAAGVPTTIYEALDKPGGRAYVFEDQGYTFDAGPTVITAPECLEKLFRVARRPMQDYVELLPISPMYRLFWEDGERFDYYADDAGMMAEIERLSPGDVAGYRQFFRYATEVYKAGYEELCHVPFLSFADMVRVAPELMRLQAWRPVYSKVASYFKSEKLRQAFSFNSLLIGGNPFSASSIYTLIHPLERKWGVFFPKGGTHALVRGLARLFTDLGGKLVLNAEIERITTASGRVTGVEGKGGHAEAFDLVVSNADVTTTYKKLLQDDADGRRAARSLQKKQLSMSLFVVYFGVSGPAYPNLVHHNVMFGHRYRELLDDIFKRGKVADDFSLYLHAPTLTDPSLAPEGGHSFYVLSPVPHLGHKDGYDWQSGAERYADKIMKYLDERYMPGLRQRVVTRRTFSPLEFQSRLGAHLGNAFSLAPTLTQSAYFRVHNRDDRIGGLYFAGAGTHPGAGIPGVIGSAEATFGVIARDLGIASVPAEAFVGSAFEAAHV